jgi:hypothetical protein
MSTHAKTGDGFVFETNWKKSGNNIWELLSDISKHLVVFFIFL